MTHDAQPSMCAGCTKRPSTERALDISWEAGAACAQVPDPDIFFPEAGQDARAAKLLCSGCAVRAECGEYGLWEAYGIWGGMSERERGAVRRKRRERAA